MEGVRGVKRPVKSSSNARREGVLGNGTGFMVVERAFEVEDDALEAFVGDVGEGGVDKIFTEDGALGEADANSCVSFEGLAGTISCGRSAIGRFGIWSASACSCNQIRIKCLCSARTGSRTSTQRRSFDRATCRLFSPSAVQRATEAIPLPMSLSRSISTSIPMPYAGIRDFDGLEKWLVGLITKPMDPRVQSFVC